MRKSVLLTIPALIVISAVGIYSYKTYAEYDMKKAYEDAYASLNVVFDEAKTVIEYGDTFDPEEALTSLEGELEVVGDVDTMQVDEYVVSYRVSGKDEKYGQDVEKIYDRIVVVEDTKAPEIKLNEEEVTVAYGSEFDAQENIESVKDVVDGDISISKEEKNNTYVVESDVDTTVAGEYTVKVKAIDTNDNATEVEYKVVVTKDPNELIEEKEEVVEEETQETVIEETIPQQTGTTQVTPSETSQTVEKVKEEKTEVKEEQKATPTPTPTPRPTPTPTPKPTPSPTPKPTPKSTYSGTVLTAWRGVVQGPSGKETYYNLDMSYIVQDLKNKGYSGEYWVRDDGVKMFGDYVLCACAYSVHPKYSTVATSLGTGICADTGGFAYSDPSIIDIATNW